MGFQQSYIQFPNFETMDKELERYKKRKNKEDDMAWIIGTSEVLQDYRAFKQGEICLVVSGERGYQRSPQDLREGLGLRNVASYRSIHFIDDLFTYDDPPYDLVEGFELDDYFKFTPLNF